MEWKNILTFGAEGRVKSALEEYAGAFQDYEAHKSKMEELQTDVTQRLVEMAESKQRSFNTLKKISKITKQLSVKDREILHHDVELEDEELNFYNLEQKIQSIEVAANSTQGIAGGLAAAGASYWLVGSIATASTGTAISTLSGAAATNATLAWLGGGSIASGGLGIAGGTVVMGGLILIPALGISALLSHWAANREIEKIKKEEQEVIKTIDTLKKNILALHVVGRRAYEIRSSVEKATEAFEFVFKDSYRRVYRIPLLSRMIKAVRKLFGYNYYSQSDLQNISQIGIVAKDIVILIETPAIQ